jgi:hypothetical protein
LRLLRLAVVDGFSFSQGPRKLLLLLFHPGLAVMKTPNRHPRPSSVRIRV